MNIPKIMGMKDKDLQLGDAGQVRWYIADKLKNGWVVLYGDMETIEMIEKTIYTPGTEKNDDFVLIMGKILPDDETITTLYLAKKTNLFKERIMFYCGISEDIYDKLIMINIISAGEGVIWDYSMIDKENENNELILNDFVNHIIKDILKMED